MLKSKVWLDTWQPSLVLCETLNRTRFVSCGITFTHYPTCIILGRFARVLDSRKSGMLMRGPREGIDVPRSLCLGTSRLVHAVNCCQESTTQISIRRQGFKSFPHRYSQLPPDDGFNTRGLKSVDRQDSNGKSPTWGNGSPLPWSLSDCNNVYISHAMPPGTLLTTLSNVDGAQKAGV